MLIEIDVIVSGCLVEAPLLPYRTHTISSLPSSTSSPARICGWLQALRVMGALTFAVLRDHSGSIQLRFDSPASSSSSPASSSYAQLRTLTLESIIQVEGVLQRRPEGQAGEGALGSHELLVTSWRLLNPCTTSLPFLPLSPLPSPPSLQAIEMRLQYRYLDLRRPAMQSLLALRSDMTHTTHNFFHSHSFLHIDTPLLYKSTPEGADEFLIPSRHKGKFWGLPQSPQQCKQILMGSGVDRYYQFAHCFRDEGSRADRQPEFIQLDIEMAYSRGEEVCNILEEYVRMLCREHIPHAKTNLITANPPSPLPRLSYHDAIHTYGNDKPDIRYNLKIANVTDLARQVISTLDAPPSFLVPLTDANSPLQLQAIHIPTPGALSRKDLDQLQKNLGEDMQLIHIRSSVWKAPAIWQPLLSNETFREGVRRACVPDSTITDGDLLLLHLSSSSSSPSSSSSSLSHARIKLAHWLCERGSMKLRADELKWLFVVDFPLFHLTLPSSLPPLSPSLFSSHSITLHMLSLSSMHHPFTLVQERDRDSLEDVMDQFDAYMQSHPSCPSWRHVPLTYTQYTILSTIRGQHYDIVCNGVEVGGGSVRVHDAAHQRRIFQLLGVSSTLFEHLLQVLSSGTPPRMKTREREREMEDEIMALCMYVYSLLDDMLYALACCILDAGAAFGFDRLVSLFGAAVHAYNSNSSPERPYDKYGSALAIRDVIAFPKTTSGQDLMFQTPTTISNEQLAPYHINIVPDAEPIQQTAGNIGTAEGQREIDNVGRSNH